MSRIPTIIDRPDGVVEGVNLKRLNELPYFLCTNIPNGAVVLVANQSSDPIVGSISGEGPIQIVGLCAQRTGACLIMMQIQDGQTIRGLMNKSCHVDTIFGQYLNGAGVNCRRPYPLGEALYVDEQRQVIFIATDISNATNSFRPEMVAQRMLSRIIDPTVKQARAKMDKRQYLTLPYFYTFDTGQQVLTAGQTVTATITVGQDSHFDLMQISAISTGVFDFDIVNIATGESIISGPQATNFPLSSNLITGQGGFPFRFHEPRFIELGTKLQVTLVDRSGAGNTIFLTLGGRALSDRMWQ